MKRIRHFERIYDPNLGTGVSSTQVVEQYVGDPDIFISFTAIDKLGINPQSKYDTPLGIYTYSVNEFFENYVYPKVKSSSFVLNMNSAIGQFAPFAGEAPYVNIIRYVGSEREIIRDISVNYSSRQFKKDSNKLRDIFIEYESKWQEEEEVLKEWNYLFEVSQSTANHKSLGGMFWNLSRYVASYTKNGGRDPVRWNVLLRELGYQAVTDHGHGIIHQNEPNQAVFFSKKAIKVIDRIKNEAAKDKKDDYNPVANRYIVTHPFREWIQLALYKGYPDGYVRRELVEVFMEKALKRFKSSSYKQIAVNVRDEFLSFLDEVDKTDHLNSLFSVLQDFHEIAENRQESQKVLTLKDWKEWESVWRNVVHHKVFEKISDKYEELERQ